MLVRQAVFWMAPLTYIVEVTTSSPGTAEMLFFVCEPAFRCALLFGAVTLLDVPHRRVALEVISF